MERECNNNKFPPLMLHKASDLRVPLQHQRKVIRFQFIIDEKLLNLAISYTDEPVKLADLVPMAQSLSDILFESFISGFESTFKVTCSKGCPYCCNYFIPISPAEAFYISNKIHNMPESKRQILLKTALSVSKHIIKNNGIKGKNNHTEPFDLQDISDWYTALKIKCPFVFNNSCSIYKQRPLACREYFVEGPAFACRPDSGLEPQIVSLPFSINKILSTISIELAGNDTSSVILPLVIPWTDINSELGNKTWPANSVAELFINTLEQSTNHQLSSTYCLVE